MPWNKTQRAPSSLDSASTVNEIKVLRPSSGSPAAAGECFIAAGDWMWMADVARVLRAELGDAARKVPTQGMPDLVLRVVALFQRPVRFVLPLLGRQHFFTSARAHVVLGWRPRPAATTIIDAARSAMATGLV